jgi:hypothetical protein
MECPRGTLRSRSPAGITAIRVLSCAPPKAAGAQNSTPFSVATRKEFLGLNGHPWNTWKAKIAG